MGEGLSNLVVAVGTVGADGAGLGVDGMAVVVCAAEGVGGVVAAWRGKFGEGEVEPDQEGYVVVCVGDIAGGVFSGV